MAGGANEVQKIGSGVRGGAESDRHGLRRSGEVQQNHAGPAQAGDASNFSGWILAEMAEQETNLRQHVLDLLAPTIKKQVLQEGMIMELQSEVKEQSNSLVHLRHLVEVSSSGVEAIERFRCELAENAKLRVEFVDKVVNDLVLKEAELTAIRQSLESRANVHASLYRAQEEVSDRLSDVKEDLEVIRREFYERLEVCRAQADKLTDELENRFDAVETPFRQIQDENLLFRGVTTDLQVEQERVSKLLNQFRQDFEAMSKEKASVVVVSSLHEEHAQYAFHTRTQFEQINQQLGRVSEQTKAHIQTALSILAETSNAQFRENLDHKTADTERIQKVLEDVETFMQLQQDREGQLQADIEELRRDSTRIVEGLQRSLEEEQAAMKKSLAAISMEASMTKRMVKDLEPSKGGALGLGIELLNMLVESQLLSAHLSRQDEQDRRQIALMGYSGKGGQGGGADSASPRLLPDIGGTGSRTTQASLGVSQTKPLISSGGGSSHKKAISVDSKCLSCSGNVGAVLAAFKLACLNYSPGPVEYRKALYSREELIALQINLLNRVKEQICPDDFVQGRPY